MTKKTRMFIETPIADTEGLADGWYYVCNPNKEILPRMVQWYNKTWNNWNEMNLSFYLRPLPEGTRVLQPGEVAVSEEDIEAIEEAVDYLDEVTVPDRYSNHQKLNQIGAGSILHEKLRNILTKLAQMGK